MDTKFEDIRNLIFDGYLKDTIKFSKFVVVIRTLNIVEEDHIADIYEHLDSSYNSLLATDTVQRAIYSINGCVISSKDKNREMIKDWPPQIALKIFQVYIKLVSRANDASKLLEDFIKTDVSKLRWSVVKATKASVNSSIITGKTEFEGLTSLQQAWVYINLQNDSIEQQKFDWSKAEYMTDSICTFINPKAMDKVRSQRKLVEEDNRKQEQIEEMKQIQKQTEEKLMIDNSADDLFASIDRKSSESALDHAKRFQESLVKASIQEDEHDKIVREHEEYEFCRQLRIKKENARRLKLLHEERMTKAVVIELPKSPQGIQVGFQQVSTLGDDDNFEIRMDEQHKDNQYYVNGIDYSDILEITSFKMLKNRDILFKQIMSESDEETKKYIDQYIQYEQEQKTEVAEKVSAIMKTHGHEDPRESLLEARERVLSPTGKTFEDRQKEMISKIQNEEADSISFGR